MAVRGHPIHGAQQLDHAIAGNPVERVLYPTGESVAHQPDFLCGSVQTDDLRMRFVEGVASCVYSRGRRLCIDSPHERRPPIVTPEQAYAELVRLSRDETVLSSCLDIVEWDEEV